MADMDKKKEMNSRRRFLITATSIAGGIASAAVATPFVLSMMPSERAKAAGAPVEVDISKLEPGMLLLVEWRGKVVWILDRTPEMLASLKKLEEQLADPKSEKDQQPQYAQNETRSIKPEILVVEGVCTHLGCSPVYRKDIAPADLGDDWLGGFFCPCHGSKFDLAGRVYKHVPAPTNLVVPPHTYLSDNLLLVGSDSKESA
jgi:ubiquinol-cytochrome c reductase iron-sulfur subunit